MSSHPSRDPAKWSTRQLKGHLKRVHCVAWSCDGKRLASGSEDHTIRIWTPERAEYRNSTKLEGHTGSIYQICWDPCNPERLASTSIDKTTRIWDIRLGKEVFSATNPNTTNLGGFINMSWSPDGAWLAAGDKADNLLLYDAKTLQQVKSYQADNEANEMVFSNGSRHLFVTVAGTIRVFSVPELEVLFSVSAHQAACITIDADPFGRYVAAGSADAVVSLWDIEEWTCVRAFSKAEHPIRKLHFSADGELIAITAEENIELYTVETGKLLYTIKIGSPVSGVWHPFKRILAYITEEDPGIRVIGV